MKIANKLIPLSMLLAALAPQTSSAGVYDTLRESMESACPAPWEDLGVSINSALPSSSIWLGDNVDKQAFVTQYAADHPTLSPAEVDADAEDLTKVAEACASYRIALLDTLVEQTPIDVAQAMVSAGQGISTQVMGWLPGDVRVTGRPVSAEGWVFLVGQSVGADSTNAILKGSQYRALYDLAKTWGNNDPDANWDSGAIVTLPDMRGRSMFGADNMGGSSANVVTETAADKVGGSFGAQSSTIAVANMPAHKHALAGAPNHSHSSGAAGAHSHKLRSSKYAGSGNSGNHTYFEGRGRPNYQATIQSSVTNAPSHTHSIGAGGAHNHTMSNTGGSQALTTISPGLTFNVEMKY